jgi:formamidopyrimidine-DNA glycosylase
LNAGLANRGTTLSHFVDGQGEQGQNQHRLLVYGRGRRGEPCPRCGRPLASLIVGGRTSHVCEHCQPPPPNIGLSGPAAESAAT